MLSSADRDRVLALVASIRTALGSYLDERQLVLPPSELLTLTLLSPFVFILHCDGRMDANEQAAVLALSGHIAEPLEGYRQLDDAGTEYNEDQITTTFRRELTYLTYCMKHHAEEFLSALALLVAAADWLDALWPDLELLPDAQAATTQNRINGLMQMAIESNLGDDKIEEARAAEIRLRLGI